MAHDDDDDDGERGDVVDDISEMINGINGDNSGVRQAVPHDGACVGEDGRGRDHGGQAAQQGRGDHHGVKSAPLLLPRSLSSPIFPCLSPFFHYIKAYKP